MLSPPVVLVLYVLRALGRGAPIDESSILKDEVQKALEYVETMRPDTCNEGVGEVLHLDFDVTVWSQYTDPAIRTANLLSKIIETNGGTLDSLDDPMFFMIVRNNVHGDSLVYGSGIALEPGIYRILQFLEGQRLPKCYHSNGRNKLQTKHVGITRDRGSLPIAEFSDGHWTKPYYDCGGGNIWMVTYSSPIFKITNQIVTFQGIATIDIEMSSLDINQCDPDAKNTGTSLDVFQGTHRCLPTTKCVPVRGLGFVVGAYQCQCINGFYFPDISSNIKAYLGKHIEAVYRNSESLTPGMFKCIACAAGCDTCIDGSPCLYEESKPLLYVVTVLMVLTTLGFLATAVATYIYRLEKVIRSASPLFLEMMCLGGILMCFKFFTVHFGPSVITCSIEIWLLHIGFFILYGSLVLKTWRISVIFTVGTYKKVNLPDQVLLQRFGFLMVFAVAILAAWTTSNIPSVETLIEGNGLKFFTCTFGFWQFAVFGVEALFLLYGVYLCFTVRKAPAVFNESKHITWAVYNAIILGSVITFMTHVLTSMIGPDLMLLLNFAQIQVYSSMTIAFIFVPKFYAIYKKTGSNPLEPSFSSISTVSSKAKRQQEFSQAPLPNTPTTQMETITDTDQRRKSV